MRKRGYSDKQHQFQDSFEIERILITRIAETGKNQLKKRRKAGLSSFYARDGKIVEVFPNNSETVRQTVKTKWVVLKKEKRTMKLE